LLHQTQLRVHRWRQQIVGSPNYFTRGDGTGSGLAAANSIDPRAVFAKIDSGELAPMRASIGCRIAADIEH
jgi:hypothetical protein